VRNTRRRKGKTGFVGLSKARLDELVEEAIVDCYNESEQVTGLHTMIEDNLAIPFETTVLASTWLQPSPRCPLGGKLGTSKGAESLNGVNTGGPGTLTQQFFSVSKRGSWWQQWIQGPGDWNAGGRALDSSRRETWRSRRSASVKSPRQ
jgi:hypothetical protein